MKMIPYNVHYEIGASLLMILLLCCIVGKKRLRTRSNNLFLCNVCLLIAGNLIDGLCGLINSGMITCSVHTQRLCNALDGSIFYLLIAAYVLYFLSLAYLTNYHNKQIFSMSILMVVLAAVCFVLPFLQSNSWSNGKYVFHGIPVSGITEGITVVYVVSAMIYLLLHEKKMGKQKKGFFLLCNIVFVGAIGLQHIGIFCCRFVYPILAVINCARDVLVDEAAICEALKSGRVKTYVSDFPNPTTAKMEGAIVLPHLGASTAEAEDNCAVMAVNELRNFIENGNIVNSVNYPNCDCGVCATEGRITVCHKNVPAVISKITTVLGAAGINISSMANQSRGDYAYSLLDIEASAPEAVVEELSAIEGVIKVRVIK